MYKVEVYDDAEDEKSNRKRKVLKRGMPCFCLIQQLMISG